MSCFKTVFYGFPDDGMEILKFLKIMVRNKKQRQIKKSLTAQWVKVSQVASHGKLFVNCHILKAAHVALSMLR